MTVAILSKKEEVKRLADRRFTVRRLTILFMPDYLNEATAGPAKLFLLFIFYLLPGVTRNQHLGLKAPLICCVVSLTPRHKCRGNSWSNFFYYNSIIMNCPELQLGGYGTNQPNLLGLQPQVLKIRVTSISTSTQLFLLSRQTLFTFHFSLFTY